MRLRGPASFVVVAGLLAGSTTVFGATDPCSGFRWNIGHEHALFATTARSAAAGRDEASAPVVRPDRLYDLSLASQQDVHFVVHPEKRSLSDGAYAGLARLHVPAAGLYRISLDKGFWIDVVSGRQAIDSRDFAGHPACGEPRKIVLYQLPAGDVVLQLSGAISPHVRLTLTRAPAQSSSR